MTNRQYLSGSPPIPVSGAGAYTPFRFHITAWGCAFWGARDRANPAKILLENGLGGENILNVRVTGRPLIRHEQCRPAEYGGRGEPAAPRRRRRRQSRLRN